MDNSCATNADELLPSSSQVANRLGWKVCQMDKELLQ